MKKSILMMATILFVAFVTSNCFGEEAVTAPASSLNLKTVLLAIFNALVGAETIGEVANWIGIFIGSTVGGWIILRLRAWGVKEEVVSKLTTAVQKVYTDSVVELKRTLAKNGIDGINAERARELRDHAIQLAIAEMSEPAKALLLDLGTAGIHALVQIIVNKSKHGQVQPSAIIGK